MSTISSADSSTYSTNASTSTTLASVLAASKVTYSEDEVTLSEEVQELLDELLYKENLSYVTTEAEKDFDSVSKLLPTGEAFDDMLDWLGSLLDEDAVSYNFGSFESDEYDRNAYQKDPELYAELWNNLYDHFTELMTDLDINDDGAMRREVLDNESVSNELLSRFTSSFSDETNELLAYFSIIV